ncbi:MAG: tRNA (cytidine/uridine-2'-O-)-methyltransferase [Chlamydiales bacterium]|jgi:tRNA (cytidine/uridine-2'-O-)-methyltransferase
MKIVLCQPQIPQNAGNIVRTCAVTGSSLSMVKPLGFSTSSRYLKRAGLDYWEGVNVDICESFEEITESEKGKVYFFSSKAEKPYTEISFQEEDILVFGSETTGLPPEYLAEWPDRFYSIPMIADARCLNLSNSVAIVVYEAWRQQGFSQK